LFFGTTRRGEAWRGSARRGSAGQGKAWFLMIDLDDPINAAATLAAIRLQSEFRIVDPLGRMVANDDLAKVIALEFEHFTSERKEQHGNQE
jgi:hypothetical protein